MRSAAALRVGSHRVGEGKAPLHGEREESHRTLEREERHHAVEKGE